MKLDEMPAVFRRLYESVVCWDGSVSLLSLGVVKKSGNPYYAVQEKKVENKVVRYYGTKNENPDAEIRVESPDGGTWKIMLDRFERYEFIDKIERPANTVWTSED